VGLEANSSAAPVNPRDETLRAARDAAMHGRRAQAPNASSVQAKISGWAGSIRRLIARLFAPARDKRPSDTAETVPCPICKGEMERGSETCPDCTMLIW
jgi:hypothetical protein